MIKEAFGRLLILEGRDLSGLGLTEFFGRRDMPAWVKSLGRSAKMSCSSKLTRTFVKMLGGALAMLVVGIGSSSASGFGEPPFTASTSCATKDSRCFPNYAVTYFSGNTVGLPDQKVRVVNTGLIGDPVNPDGNANICVNFYVFDTQQEMEESCGCLETPDALLVTSVQTQLTNNPLTGAVPAAGVIKITATYPTKDSSGKFTQCSPISYGILPTNEIMAGFATHLQVTIGGGVAVTETNLVNRPLSWNELNTLRREVPGGYFPVSVGVCTCPAEK
jgi:hypothetical protein